MIKPRQIFSPDNRERKNWEKEIRDTGQFAIIHDHREDYGCAGDCLMLNLPDEVRADLSDEV